MGMNFREVSTLIHWAESNDRLATALKGGKAAKEFRSEREALEKAAGGKKKLEQADKVLADARAAAEKMAGEAVEKTDILSLTAAGKIKAGAAALDERDRHLAALALNINKREDALGVKAQELEDATQTFKAHETGADERERSLDHRESKVGTRELNATRREVEIKRFDDWRATAPA